MASIPAVELAALVNGLPIESQTARLELGDQLHEWLHGQRFLNANVARLLDVVETWLAHEWARWTADPDEVAAEQRKRRREGRRPSPVPLIEPVAERPDAVHAALFEQFLAMAAEHHTGSGEPTSSANQVSSDEFDAQLGL